MVSGSGLWVKEEIKNEVKNNLKYKMKIEKYNMPKFMDAEKQVKLRCFIDKCLYYEK